MFRRLKVSEIECRVSTVSANGCSLLLYKDARSDMNILDETVGPFNWKREHTRNNSNCVVSIWDESKQQWISKEDTGAESFTEKEKGLASDSFKRACFNWGIGRELYTAPFIWINIENVDIKPKGQGYTTNDKFEVEKIEYNEFGTIVDLSIKNAKTGKKVFSLTRTNKQTNAISNVEPQKAQQQEKPQQPTNVSPEKKLLSQSQVARLYAIAKTKGRTSETVQAAVKSHYKIDHMNELTKQQYDEVVKKYEAMADVEEVKGE